MVKILFLILVSFGLSSSWAQEYEGLSYDEIVSDVESAQSSNPVTVYSFGFSSRGFSNSAYRLAGDIHSFSGQVTSPREWILGVDLPYLIGSNAGQSSQEMGNARIRTQLSLWDIDQSISLWFPFSVRLAQRGDEYQLASRHDTYRAGLELEVRKGIFSSLIGGGYQARVFETDPRLDIGDIVDASTTLRFQIVPSLAFRTQFEWYSVAPTKIRKQVVGKPIEWAAISPGFSFEIASGLNLLSEIIFPVYQTGTPTETDLAFGEIYYPQTSYVTWGWGLGANF